LRAKETLEATIATLPDAVLVIDPEGRIVTLNPLARSVLQATGAAGASSIEELPFPAHSLTALHAALRGESSTQVRAEFSRTFLVSLDGRRRKFILTVLPIPEFRDEDFGAVAILYDVTDFARLDELRTELIAVASHELKTPLTTLRMNLLLLGEKAENLTARQHEILATAVLGCHELASTIDELLDLTRIEAGQLRLTRDSVDLYAVIDRAIASLSQRFEDAEVKLHVGGNGKPAFLLGDPARLAMVFTNLLSNARQTGASGPRCGKRRPGVDTYSDCRTSHHCVSANPTLARDRAPVSQYPHSACSPGIPSDVGCISRRQD
jgi:NtrC-family two-component system sensor histidine kinase KinB